MNPKTKKPKESIVQMTEIVLPNDTNPFNNLMGGRLMHWMDIVSAVAAQKHSNRMVVTASVDNISFESSIPLGSVVTLTAKVTRAFNTSMEIFIDVYAENFLSQTKTRSNAAYFTFVALNEQKKPVSVPKIIPETKEEVQNYEEALQRRQLRLILSKKMKINHADELKRLLEKNSQR